jgi:hypothetical protein
VTWDRAAVAGALVTTFGAVTPVKVHAAPPETLNPMCIVVGRPDSVSYNTIAFSIDQATLPVMVVGGLETEDQIEALKALCRQAVGADPTLGGTVQAATATEERNWRNVTGAGGIQLLLVELVLAVQM